MIEAHAEVRRVPDDLLARHAVDLNAAAGGVADVLDGVHRDGLAVPPAVHDAMRVVCSFSIALAANAAGVPCPEPHRQALGLDRIPTGSSTDVDDDDGRAARNAARALAAGQGQPVTPLESAPEAPPETPC